MTYVTAEALWSVSLRVKPCCPGCRGWKLKGSSWRSPVGTSTQLSLTHSPNTVSSCSYFIIYSECLRSNTLQINSLCLLHIFACFFNLSLHLPLWYYIVDHVSVYCQNLLYPSLLFTHNCPALCIFALCLTMFTLSIPPTLFISRCWDPLCEYDSTDQRPPPLLLLGCRQETYLHWQRQHGLEISGHSMWDCHTSQHTQSSTHSNTIFDIVHLILLVESSWEIITLLLNQQDVLALIFLLRCLWWTLNIYLLKLFCKTCFFFLQ